MTSINSPVALITGASAGIGAEFARQLARRGYSLVLVSRDHDRLELAAAALRTAEGVQVEVLAADLSTRQGCVTVEDRLSGAEGKSRVTMLVNNAGAGLRDLFDQNPVEWEQQNLDLLVTAPMRLAHAALAQMLAARNGTIVNIASVAGFIPRGTYGASKAWLVSFSRWANITYRRRGVSVTAVAPGFVHTEFHDRMAVSTAGIPPFMWLDAATLVRLALRDIDRGRGLSVPTARYKLVVLSLILLPKKIVAAGALRRR